MTKYYLCFALIFASGTLDANQQQVKDQEYKMTEALGYFSFSRSFLEQCEKRFPKFKDETLKARTQLVPFENKIKAFFFSDDVSMDLQTHYKSGSYKSYTDNQVNQDFDSGKYTDGSCRYALDRQFSEGLDKEIVSYFK